MVDLTQLRSPQARARPPGSPFERTNILIVEDEALLALHAEQLLSGAGFLVVGVAPDAQTAIRLVEKMKPDLVLMDVRLRNRDADGVDTAVEIWQRFGIRSLFVTGNAELARSPRAAAANSVGVIAKPYQDAELVRAVRAAVASSSLEAPLAPA